jgi:hypothetical protein
VGDLVFYYRQYERLMARWRTLLPTNRLLDIKYGSLIAERESLTRRMIAVCGLLRRMWRNSPATSIVGLAGDSDPNARTGGHPWSH